MASEFNAASTNDLFRDYDGRNNVQMPLLLRDNRYPMFTAQIIEERLQGRGLGRFVDTGDLVAYRGPRDDNQEIKFILTAKRNGLTPIGKFALDLINQQSKCTFGAINLYDAKDSQGKRVPDAYESLTGPGVITMRGKDLGTIEKRMRSKNILEHRGWRIRMRHPDEVPKEFAENFELAKEYVERIVSLQYDSAMGEHHARNVDVPTLRAWSIFGFDAGAGSDARCWTDLGDKVGRLVGVAQK